METRSTNLNHTDTLRVGERGGRDVSPRGGRDVSPHAGAIRRRHEEERRREKGTRRTGERPRDRHAEAHGWKLERDSSFTTFKGREGETERDRRREREEPRRPNGRVASMLEVGPVPDREGDQGKGETFPRMRRPSKERRERRPNIIPENEKKGRDCEVERGAERTQERPGRMETYQDGSRERDRDAAQRRDKDTQKYREEERQRERERARLIEDWKSNVQRSLEKEDRRRGETREYDSANGQERRRDRNPEGIDPRSPRREMDRERGTPRPNDRPLHFYSPQRQRERDKERGMDSPRGADGDRREGQRDTRSEGESDGARGNARPRVDYSATLQHKHSRSEGDSEGGERRVKMREREREKEAEYQRQREREREVGRSRDGRHDRDRPRERAREAERDVEKRRDEFSETQRRRRDERGGRGGREEGRPYPRGDNTGQRREGERPPEKQTHSDREREQRRTRERARDGEDRESLSSSSSQFRTQPRAQSSGEWMSGSDLEIERRRRGARDGVEGKESGRESTPESELERRRPREQDLHSPRPVQGKVRGKAPESQDATVVREGEERSNEREREVSKTGGVGQDERVGESPGETKTPRRMWLVPGAGRARNSRGSSQEEDLPPQPEKESLGREMGPETKAEDAARESLQEKFRKLEIAGEFAGGSQGQGGAENSESESTDEREANATEESDREREDGSDASGEILGVWRTSPSVEDGFVTVSSGGEEEEEEENFEDCKEFWDGGVRDDATRQSLRGHEGRTKSDKGGTVFCVVGNKLPRKEPHRRAYLDLDNLESVGSQADYSDLEINNRRSLDLTGATEKNKQEPARFKDGDPDERAEYEGADLSPSVQEAEGEPERQTPSKEQTPVEVTTSSDVKNNSTPEANANPRVGTDMPAGLEDYGYAVIRDRKPEEDEHITEQPGRQEKAPPEQIWVTAEEMKRHSQMPHLKWAKNVVLEILGASEDRGLQVASEAQTETPAEDGPEAGAMPVYATVQKRLKATDTDSETILPELEVEEEQPPPPVDWEGPRGSVVHAGNLTPADVHVKGEVEMHGESETQVHGEGNTGMLAETEKEEEMQTGMSIQVHIQEEELGAEEREGSGETEGSGNGKNVDSEVESTKLTEPASQSRDSSAEREAGKEAGKEAGEGQQGVGESKLRDKVAILSTNSFRDLGSEARLRRRGIRKTVEKGIREQEVQEEEGEGDGGVSRDRRTRIFPLSGKIEGHTESDLMLKSLSDFGSQCLFKG